MGSQIAAHCAGCGSEVALYGMPASSHPQESAQAGLERLAKLKPSPFVNADCQRRVRALDYDSHLDELAGCDLVIEAIVEDHEAKAALYGRIAEHLGADAILASNTSGIRIESLAQSLDERLAERFLGLHFFNPPRYQRLMELIAAPRTDPGILHRLSYYLTTTLGKHIVFANDSPAFIGNRVGIFALLSCVHQAARRELPPDTVDALTGPLMARARSATFRTLDIVGLDICKHVVEGVHSEAPSDPWSSHLALPDWLLRLHDSGALGAKSGRGVYHKRGSEIWVVDPASGEYRVSSKLIDNELRAYIKKQSDFAEALLGLSTMQQPQASYLWACYCDIFQYAAFHAKDIAPSLADIDFAWRLGFGAQLGIFEIAQKAGWSSVVEAVSRAIADGLTLSSQALPEWCTAIEGAYAKAGAYAPQSQGRIGASTHPVYERQLDPLRLHGQPSPIDSCERIHDSEWLRCLDLGDGIACVGFKTKMRVISHEIIEELNAVLDQIESSHSGLVIWQGDGPFCAGANLFQLLAGVKFGTVDSAGGWWKEMRKKTFEWMQPDLPPVHHLPPVREVVKSLQSLHLRLRHSPLPVIAAVQNLALGGGCEMLMHCDRVVAHNESYMGLVEIGVGLLPGGGGCTEMARRAALAAGEDPLFPHIMRAFKDIALAYVSTSASEARAHGFLGPSDVIMANPDELAYIAKREALSLQEQCYAPPAPADIRVVGRMGKANLLAELDNLLVGGFISEHDHLCASRIAHCLCGGDVAENTELPLSVMHNLEVEGFVALLQTEPSQARIEHMLRKGKPLRN